MRSDAQRVVLKRDGRVFVDDANTGWKWIKAGDWHVEFILRDENGKQAVNHYSRSVFVLKVLDFHNGCGEFA
tara:strand:+ start:607 stop:822 length:216 start_codon:yes stop_codon:yes gene_type:complete